MSEDYACAECKGHFYGEKEFHCCLLLQNKWKSLAGEMMKSLLKATDCTGTTHFNCHRCDLLAKAREAGL